MIYRAICKAFILNSIAFIVVKIDIKAKENRNTKTEIIAE